jgi:hypothetical protein
MTKLRQEKLFSEGGKHRTDLPLAVLFKVSIAQKSSGASEQVKRGKIEVVSEYDLIHQLINLECPGYVGFSMVGSHMERYTHSS